MPSPNRPTPRLPSPYRPDPTPHRIRTAALVAWSVAVLVALAWMASAVAR